MTLSLNELSANLIELYQANQNGTSLIPNNQATRLYEKNTLLGIIWSMYASTISGREKASERQTQALELTKKTFNHFVENFDHISAYPDQKEDLLLFDQMTHFFRKWAMQKGIFSEFTCISLEPTIKAYRKIMALELLSPDLVPVNLIKNINHTKKEEETIKEWYLHVRKNVTVRSFHRALLAINENPIEVAHLEKRFISFETLKTTLFRQLDEKHLKWRQNLPHQTLTIDGQTFEVDAVVNPKTSKTDRFQFFTFKNDTTKGVYVGPNETLLHIQALYEGNKSLLKERTSYQIDLKGRFAIVQRLKSQASLDSITRYFKQLVNDNNTPYPIKARHLMQDCHGKLYSSKIYANEIFRIEALEKVLFLLANKDLEHFKKLVLASKLTEHPHFRSIQERMRYALILGEFEKTANEKINQLRIDSKTYKKVMNVRCTLLEIEKDLHTKYPGKESAVREALWNAYKDTQAVTILWPNIKEVKLP